MARKYRHFVYDKNQRFVYPTSDWGFKHIFGTEKNKDLLLGVLRKLLPELNIESIEYLPRDITIPVGKMRDAKFDVFCKLHDESNVVIEMQSYADKTTFLDRSLVYTSAALLEHYVNSKVNGYKIHKTIFLAFLGDAIFKDVERTPVRLSLCDIDEVLTVVRNDKMLQIFVELPKFAGSLDKVDENTPFVEKLAHVLMEMADCKGVPENLSDPLLEDIFKAADTFGMSMSEQEEYFKSIIGEYEYYATLEGACEAAREEAREEARAEGREKGLAEGREEGLAEGREKGLAEGRKEGLAEGREKGLAEGREAGLAEGRSEGILQTAKNLLAEGIPIDVISKCTGLGKEDILMLSKPE